MEKDKLINDNRQFSKFSSMIVGDKMSLEDKKKLGIYVYDPSELNDESRKKAQILKKLKKYGVQISEDIELPQSPKKDGEAKYNSFLEKIIKSKNHLTFN